MTVEQEQASPTYVQFRLPETQADINFVLKAWMKAFRAFSWGSRCTDTVFYEEQQRLIGQIAARPNCRLIIAANAEKLTQLYGYMCAEPANGDHPLVVHWVYVKFPFRKLGLAKQMLAQFGWERDDQIVATHVSQLYCDIREGRRLRAKYNITHNPFILMRQAHLVDYAREALWQITPSG